MTNIANFYKQSELSLAAYADLVTGISGQQFIDALKDGGNGMSATQASSFSDN